MFCVLVRVCFVLVRVCFVCQLSVCVLIECVLCVDQKVMCMCFLCECYCVCVCVSEVCVNQVCFV